MTTHRGSIQTWAPTLDKAIHEAHVQIATHVGARTYEFRTDSEPVAYDFSGRPGSWRVDVTWWVIDPVPAEPRIGRATDAPKAAQ